MLGFNSFCHCGFVVSHS